MKKNIIWISITAVLFLVFIIGLAKYKSNFTNIDPLTETDARIIAEKTCIKSGESLGLPGYYNEKTKSWWFVAFLNSTQDGCRPSCVVSENTKTAEIDWDCTESTTIKQSDGIEETIKKIFASKYQKPISEVAVNISRLSGSHLAGSVVFGKGSEAEAGAFLAVKINEKWEVVYDGNGSVDCNILQNTYKFPKNILTNFCD